MTLSFDNRSVKFVGAYKPVNLIQRRKTYKNKTMSFIEFESGWDKEKARQELREVRAELLKRVKYKI